MRQSSISERKDIQETKLTIEELREFDGFEDIEEEQGQELIDFLHGFCILIYENYVSTPKTSQHYEQ